MNHLIATENRDFTVAKKIEEQYYHLNTKNTPNP